MGYYTNYDVTVHNATEKQMKDISKFFTANCGLEKCDAFKYYGYDMKWYYWNEDIEKISKNYPNIYFEVYGDGEESDDKWRAIVCDGYSVVVQAELVYPDINIQKIGGIGKRCPELFI